MTQLKKNMALYAVSWGDATKRIHTNVYTLPDIHYVEGVVRSVRVTQLREHVHLQNIHDIECVLIR